MHTREDEYSYVLEGRLGALLGDDEVYAEPGDFVFKPRDQWHTFWNAGDGPCRILEIIAPGGFEHMFREMGELTQRAGPRQAGRLHRALRDSVRPGGHRPSRRALRAGAELRPGRGPYSCVKTDFVSR